LTVAWLNSTAVAEHHRSRVREANQSAFPQLKLRHLRALPHPGDAPPGLVDVARAVARDGRLDLAPELDVRVAEWLARWK